MKNKTNKRENIITTALDSSYKFHRGIGDSALDELLKDGVRKLLLDNGNMDEHKED